MAWKLLMQVCVEEAYGQHVLPLPEEEGVEIGSWRRLHPCHMYRRTALYARKPRRNKPHILTGTSAWNDIYEMCDALQCCLASANVHSPNKFWKAAVSGKSCSLSTS